MNRILAAAIVSTAVLVAAKAPAQTWTTMKVTPSFSGYNPLLLTDGTVLVQDGDNSNWWKLTPDAFGNYSTGTWTQLASTPGYGPLYYASDVMPDGRVFTMGGEYNLGSGTIWQNLGYIYDPVTNSWTFLPAPSGWGNIGDMGSMVLPNGQIMICDPFSSQAALFNPATNSFTAPYGHGKFDGNDEEGLTMLPDGTILTVDTTPQHSEIFNPVTATWTFAGTTPASLVGGGEEIGPQVLRYDGTVICFGGGGHNCIYNSTTKTWTQAPDFPVASGSTLYDCADAPACLLTNGNVLVMTSPGLFMAGCQFFEWNGTKMAPAPNTANGPSEPSFVGSMLMLPTGQVMLTDLSPTVLFYNSVGNPNAAWAPTITNVSTVVTPGQSYVLSGTQLNGLSGSSAYGDDEQNYTNYPMIRITNNKTGHVFYCKEFNPSTMQICTGSQIVSTNFTVPKTIDQGASTIQVVTNGIPSKAVAILVGPPSQPTAVSTYQGKYIKGNLASILAVDGNSYEVQSILTGSGYSAVVEADFILPGSATSITVTASASATGGVTGMLYLYNWQKGTIDYIAPSSPLGAGQIVFSAQTPGSTSPYIGSGNKVKAYIRGLIPTRTAKGPFNLNLDFVQIS